MEAIFEKIKAERKRQNLKFGAGRTHHPMEWNAILGEEFGEVSKEVVEYTFNQKQTDDMITELIQVAAVVFAWIEDLEQQKAK